MSKHVPVILLATLCAVLAVALYRSDRQVTALEKTIADLERTPMPRVAGDSPPAKAESPRPSDSLRGSARKGGGSPAGAPAGEGEDRDGTGRRMMSNLSKMLENPTMTKVMKASQRGALEALYGDLIESFEFSDEERGYFVDLLMSRQMKQVEMGMKMMGGGMSDADKKRLEEELQEVSETVKTEMNTFLNNAEDYAEFEFYEKTMGERMMLSQMGQTLETAEAPLSDETRRALLEMMHDERKNFPFSTDLQDQDKVDLSAERFSKENLEQFSGDMDRLNRRMIGKAASLLGAEQLKAFEESIEAMAEMQKSQMEMAANMFRGGEEKE